MNITITYFSSLRESLGRGEQTITVDQPISALDAWVVATGETELPAHLLIAINHEYKDAQTLINEGDELAFFPPVTGG
ncbi:MAG: MoaD/ThiS family protein [Thiotrichaceae bacterium]|nr:MoaD/ThiS family protein [Thiotrichaceae bacterium]